MGWRTTAGGARRLRTRATRPAVVRAVTLAEDAVYLLVAIVLVGLALALLYHTVHEVFDSDAAFLVALTEAVNGVLLVVIVLEIFRTVLAHFDGGGFQLRPFLIIGVISAVRHILLVGARSVTHEPSDQFTRSQIELGVNAGLALVLVVALVLVHRAGALEDPDSDE